MAPEIILFNFDGSIVKSHEFKEIVPLLCNKGYRLVAISEKNKDEIENYILENNLSDYFDFLHSTSFKNPNFNEILKYFNRDPSVMAYIGENLDEMDLALKNGFGFIAITEDKKENFNNAGCYIVLNSIKDLI